MGNAVTSKGQVTIPKAIRDRLGLRTGSKVEFDSLPDGEIVLKAAGDKRPPNRFRILLGHAGKGPGTDEIMALLRGET